MGTISAVIIVIMILGAAGLGFILALMIARFNYEMKLGKIRREKSDQPPAAAGPTEKVTDAGRLKPAKTVSNFPDSGNSPYDPADTFEVGGPVDFIVFPGLSRGEVREVILVLVRAEPNPVLTETEGKIRDLIERGRTRWVLARRI